MGLRGVLSNNGMNLTAATLRSAAAGYAARWTDLETRREASLPKESINPPSVFRSLEHGFSQAVVASGRRTLYVSGQTAWDSQKQLIGGTNLELQARQAFSNVRAVVEAAGGTLGDVVSLRIYVVDYRPDKAVATRLATPLIARVGRPRRRIDS